MNNTKQAIIKNHLNKINSMTNVKLIECNSIDDLEQYIKFDWATDINDLTFPNLYVVYTAQYLPVDEKYRLYVYEYSEYVSRLKYNFDKLL